MTSSFYPHIFLHLQTRYCKAIACSYDRRTTYEPDMHLCCLFCMLIWYCLHKGLFDTLQQAWVVTRMEKNHLPVTSYWQTYNIVSSIASSTTRHDRDSNSQRWWYTLIAVVVVNPIIMRSRPKRPLSS
jgi:hypothetical protein